VIGTYDVYLDWNSGSPVLNFLAWTSNSARGTALIQQDGVYCVGINTRRYLGTIYLHATGLTQDTLQFRQVWNYYNRVRRKLLRVDPASSWTLAANTVYRQANANSANYLGVVKGALEDSTEIEVRASVLIAGGQTAEFGIGLGNVTNIGEQNLAASVSTGSTITTIGTTRYVDLSSLGYQTYWWLELSAIGTLTLYGGGASGGILQSGLHGSIWG